MKLFILAYSFFSLLIISSLHVVAQTQKDTLFAYLSETPVVIDGKADDACWANAEWHNIGVVWLPYYNAPMEDGDFSGRFKLAWDSLYLYLLVEINDDSLSDDHVNPTDNYWNDDCVEIFVDENRSKGDHLNNYNAFAYHVSTYYDAIDGGTGSAINLKNNLTVVMDTIAEHTYLWEFALKMYNASFKPNSPEASRVFLHHNKLMGFSLAYCDNDETTSRENFIGSTDMPANHSNDNYITADYFGSLLLVDPNATGTSVDLIQKNAGFNIYPNPVNDRLYIRFPELSSKALVSVYDQNGRIILQQSHQSGTALDVSGLPEGIYQLAVQDGEKRMVTSFVKQ